MFGRYYRLTKPGIIYGNLVTAMAGYLLASKFHIHVATAASVLAGTALVIAGSCVVNNYLDRAIDKKMARTKFRELVSGTISARHAISYATALLILGFILLIVGTNWLTVVIGALAAIDYVIFYGLSKRRSTHGTLIGSIAGAAPILAGFTSVSDRINAGAISVFLILVCWQMPHFFAIALYRYDDYRAAGLPVLPVKKNPMITKIQILIYVVLFTVACSLLYFFHYTGYIYLIVMTILGLVWLYRGVVGFSSKDTASWARGMFGLSLVIIMGVSVMVAVGPHLP